MPMKVKMKLYLSYLKFEIGETDLELLLLDFLTFEPEKLLPLFRYDEYIPLFPHTSRIHLLAFLILLRHS